MLVNITPWGKTDSEGPSTFRSRHAVTNALLKYTGIHPKCLSLPAINSGLTKSSRLLARADGRSVPRARQQAESRRRHQSAAGGALRRCAVYGALRARSADAGRAHV